MSQALAVFNPAGMPENVASLFGGMVAVDDLTSGAEAAFPILSVKGRVFRVKHGGDERVLQRDGQPLFSLDVVLLKANPQLSKLYYSKAYAEGDDAAPECSSANGITPDTGVPNPQSTTCAACPQNVWGSKITPQGTKTKACADMRRLAVVPERDIACQTWGAPLLLRVPPASLRSLSEYGRTQLGGKPYTAVVTRISFDLNVAYPKLTFAPIRWLDATEAQAVLAWMNDPIVGRIIGTDADPSAPNTRNVIPIHPVAAPVAPTPAPAPAVVTPIAADPFAQVAPVAPVVLPTPAPVVVQPPVVVDSLAGVPEALKTAINAVGGPETEAGKAILATLAPAQVKRTRRSKAEMEAARAAAPTTPVYGDISPRTAINLPEPAPQGELVARVASLPNQMAGVASANGAGSPPAPSGQEDLLAGVDALLAGLDNLGFDD